MIGIDEPGLPVGLRNVVRPRPDALKCALYNHYVPLLDQPLPKLPGQVPGGLRRSRQGHHPRRGPVKPVHRPEKRRRVRLVGQQFFATRDNVRVAGVIGLGKQPRRLVDDQQVLIAVQNGHDASSWGI
jgi:hypothetical protein